MEKRKKKRVLAIVLTFLVLLSVISVFIYLRRNTEFFGDIEGEMTVDGMMRTYRYYLPQNLHENMPLLIALHGGGGSGRDMEKLTGGGFNKLAEKEGFIVLYPDAVEKHWNDGRGLEKYYSQRENIDDVGFISALIERFKNLYKIDESRVYVTGMSNGALMCFRLMSEIPEKIRAIAPVSGYIPVNLLHNWPETCSVSVMIIGGTSDPLVPWNGGTIRFGNQDLGEVFSAEESARYCANSVNCSVFENKTVFPDIYPEDGTVIWKERWLNPVTGDEVVLYGIEGGGHTWPGGYQYLPESIIGKTSREMDACSVIWNFFKEHQSF